MRALWIAVVASSATAAAVPAPLPLAEAGKTTCRIAVARDATAAERHAAGELSTFLQDATGASFPVCLESEAADGPLLLVGFGSKARALLPDLDPASFGPDEFIIRSRDRHLILAGGRPRGTLYAVYTFLENHIGCRWFSSKVTRVPRTPDLRVPALDERHKPAFAYREPFAFDSFDGDWAARNKCNGHSARLDEKHGGRIVYQGFVHTFLALVPPDQYFAAHPEYFSEIDGKRTAERSQLCLTNPDLPALVAARVLEAAKDAPPSTIVSVSQNDWHGWCECAKCRAATEREGSVSGPLLDFVNQVAEHVEKSRPDLVIDTLAYQKSRKPPRHAKPRPNVVVRLCSIECSFAHPLEGDGPNRDFAADIEGWGRLCRRLHVWDYVTNFAHYIQPHPNFRVLQPNLRFFARHGVEGVFEQGGYQSPGGEFQELRSWVLAKLLWNPQADTNRLVDEFLAGYYGPAAAPVRRYFDLMHDGVTRSGHFLSCYSPVTAPFLDRARLLEADRLWREAETIAAATGDKDLLARVQVGRLPVDYVLMLRESAWKRLDPPWQPTRAGHALREWFFATAAKAGITHVSEPRCMADFRAAMLLPGRREPAPPPACANLPAERWFDIQEDELRLARPGEWVIPEADPQASDGVAARMPANHREWAIQVPFDLPTGPNRGAKRWKVSLSVRVEKTGDNGTAFTCGIYDAREKRSVADRRVLAADVTGPTYQNYDLGSHEPSADRYLWIAPDDNPANVRSVRLDRIVLIADESP